MDRLLVTVSTLFFLIGCVRTWQVLNSGGDDPGLIDYGIHLAGFLGQFGFLLTRSVRTGHCPVTNSFEILIFVCWSVCLFYLLVGATYRMSPLGLFTAPSLFVAQALALWLAPDPEPIFGRGPTLFWIELHAALSLMAYGAFGLAAVASIVYLLQDNKLRKHQPDPSFFQLPPLVGLRQVTIRLMFAGFVALSVGLVAGFSEGIPATWVKLASGIFVWLAYALALAFRMWRPQGPRRGAVVAIVAFVLALLSLGGMEVVKANNSKAVIH